MLKKVNMTSLFEFESCIANKSTEKKEVKLLCDITSLYFKCNLTISNICL
mgnify:CR=1 FL=1